ncbi:MAG: hypothetical protein K0M73_09620, partial [Hydrogenophaga sp.]|nr:hypothetical protein [Hydrogenophaga sp.]
NIRSNNVTLVSRTGSIGEEDNALDVGVNPDGHVVATADTVGQGIYLNGPSGEHFNVGASTSGGATVLSAAESMKVDGNVTGLGSISLVSGGLTTLTTQADVTSTAASIQIRAGSLTMEDDGVAAARVRSGTGSIDVETVGDAVITGIESGNGTASAVRVVSTGGRVLDGGDTRLDVIADTAPAAKFTVAGLLGVGSDGNPLDVRVRDLNASSVQGSVALAAVGGVNIEAVSAGDAVQITADGDITGNSVTSTGAGTQGLDKSVSVASTGGRVTLDSVSGTGLVNVDGQTGVDVNSVESTGGSVVLNSNAGNVVVDTTRAQQDVTMTAAAGTVTAGTTTATDGNVNLSALGDIEATTTVAGGTAQVTSAAGHVRLGSLTARGDVSVDGQAGVQTGTVESTAGSVVLNTDGGDIDAGFTKAWKDVTMRAASGAISADTTVATTGNVTFIARGDINTGSTTAGGTVVFDSEEGDVRTDEVSTGGAFTIETAGNIETGTVTAGRDVSLISTRGTVTADNTRSVRGSVTMEGQQGVTANRVVAAQDVTLASARGAVDAGSLLARRGSITLSARRNIDVGTGTATNGSFVAGSTGGSVNVGTASADVVSLSAPRSVSARTLNVGSRLNLAGQNIAANVNSTGAGDVGGSVTGFGGGMASNVELALNSPFAFRFQEFSTSTGNVNVLAGDLFVDAMRVGNRLTISNPRTTLLIDQNDRSIQPFDVQLYSAGSPFAFGLTGNRVLTGAFVISRGPGHEVISPNGNNLSAAELGDRELSVLGTLPSPTDGFSNGQPDAEALAGLVTFVGTPVNGGDECGSEAGQGAGDSNNSKCKEEN